MTRIDDSQLRKILIGRIVPYIYSFETNTLPNYLKVGDTYRPVEERLDEWRSYYRDLREISRHEAVVDRVFFRDYAVHQYLKEADKLQADYNPDEGVYSREFFENTTAQDIESAVSDIKANYKISGKYSYYSDFKQKEEYHFVRSKNFTPRSNQQEVLENFTRAIKVGRTNLLMYAVMRFGKSITSMWAAKSINSKLTVIVSGKADVKNEWKETVESHQDFTGYRFLDANDLKNTTDIGSFYGKTFKTGDSEEVCTNIVIFFTLQDLAGSSKVIKKHHEILQSSVVDLLIIDETHFGARAQVLGKILAGVDLNDADENLINEKSDEEDIVQPKNLKAIQSKIKLHLSGTPYRILMGSEFQQEDIIAFVQFSDIYEAKLDWAKNNLEAEEWDNDYYGFPQMIRFAFNPNESSRKLLEKTEGSKLADLFSPESVKKAEGYDKFVHQQEVIDLLQVLDGTKADGSMLSLLDNPTVKAGKLTRHIVMVLPYKASCDAMEKLIRDNKQLFKNLSGYQLFNISGYNQKLEKPSDIKQAIANAEEKGQKTLTLTVNKMLTGTTVPQWDTMLFLKSTASPQEYDQAIFRLQSPWVKTYKNNDDETIKYDMKPQTLLVDLDPTRMFHLQELKAFTYGVNTATGGGENIESSIEKELRISPIITVNAENNKLVEVSATNIIDIARKYASERAIREDVNEIGVDVSLQNNLEIYEFISKLAEFGGNKGLNIKPTEGEGDDIDVPEEEPGADEPRGGEDGQPIPSSSGKPSDDESRLKTFEKRFRTFYVAILLFAFLSETEERSLAGVINNIDANEDNTRIARSLGLNKENLQIVRSHMNEFVLKSLDYKILNADSRSGDESLSPAEHIDIAINKFGRLSDSEVFTPKPIVDKMFDAFDEGFWQGVENKKILDIASKSGSFASGFMRKVSENGVDPNAAKDSFYSIPTSKPAYEFTRKMYTALGLNINNIATHFDAYDIIKLSHDDLKWLLSQDKKFCDIRLSDLESRGTITGSESEGRVKFDAVVGNPPYDERQAGEATDKRPIYHLFFESAKQISSGYVSLIHPARFLFNGGKTPKSWNKQMLNDFHLSVPFYEPDSKKVFADVDIKGGVAITFWNRTDASGGLGGSFIAFEELRSISDKVGNGGLDQIVSTAGGSPTIRYDDKFGRKRSYFRTSAFFDLPDFFMTKPDEAHTIKIVGLEKGNKRSERYVNRDMLRDSNLEKWKVFLPESNGSGAIGEVMSTPLVGEPLVGCTESFIQIGSFDSEIEAQNCMKYIKTKFCRTMLGTLKITQHNPKSTWRNVPLQDFTQNSDIDWTRSIPEIDQQLYAKYHLDAHEIAFIESKVKAME